MGEPAPIAPVAGRRVRAARFRCALRLCVLVLAVVAGVWFWPSITTLPEQAQDLRRWYLAPPAMPPETAAARLEAAEHLEPLAGSIQRGFAWMLRFHAPEARMGAHFGDYLIFLDEMAEAPAPGETGPVAEASIQYAMGFLRSHAGRVFPATSDGAWDFIASVQTLLDHHGSSFRWRRFYREQLAQVELHGYRRTFGTAAALGDHDTMSEQLIDQSFLHHLLQRYPKWRTELGVHEHFLDLLPQAPVDKQYGFAVSPNAYHHQSYYFTHLPLVLTNYGRGPALTFDRRAELRAYFRSEAQVVLEEVGDLDLVGEFLQALVLLDEGGSPLAERIARYLVARQRPDGAWGTDEDLAATDPYDAMHPTWAALSGLKAYWAAGLANQAAR